jgi:DNA-binding response OmpR family regulator
LEAKADAFLQKPFRGNELYDIIQQVLQNDMPKEHPAV